MMTINNALMSPQQNLQNSVQTFGDVLNNVLAGAQMPSKINQMKAQAQLLAEQAQMYPQVAQSEIQGRLADAIAQQVNAAKQSAILNALQQHGLNPGFTPNYALAGGAQSPQSPLTGPVGTYGTVPTNQQYNENAITRQLRGNIQNSSGDVPTGLTQTINGNPPVSNLPMTNNQISKLQGLLAGSSAQTPATASAYSGPNPSYSDMVVNEALFNNPLTPQQQVQQRQAEAAAAAQGAGAVNTNLQQYKEDIDNAQQQSSAASQFNNLMNQWEQAYNGATSFVGPINGKIKTDTLAGGIASLANPKEFANAQYMDKLSPQMAAALSKMENMGILRGPEIAFAQSQKFERTMSPQAKEMMGDFMKAVNDRQNQQLDFFTNSQQLGIPNPVAKRLYNDFITQRPIAAKDGMQYGYLGTQGDYLTPQAIQAAEAGRDYTPPNQQYLTDFNKKIIGAAKELNTTPLSVFNALKRKQMRGGGV